jgi:hypothetical protein
LTNKRQNSYGPLTLALINKFKLLPQGALCMEDVVNFLTTMGLSSVASPIMPVHELAGVERPQS